MSDEVKTAWVSFSRREEKPWGYEIVWSSTMGAYGKTIFLNKGCRSSLKVHSNKNEVLFIRSGKVFVEYGNEENVKFNMLDNLNNSILREGDCLNVQSGCPYRVTALEDSEIIEISDNLSSSVLRIKDDYGRVSSKSSSKSSSEESSE